ncbi:MAG: hypothetical protein JXA90_15810, partial [Planctomycetes bacterium]|nr:hypothetical protein [Planctomycetota bacterium]
KRVADRAVWPELERYVRDIAGRFRDDRRILIWDLYNEPGNSSMGETSLPLAEAAFAWARIESPSQPLTIGVWTGFESRMSRRLAELSDIVSLHAYDRVDGVRAKIEILAKSRRPLVATEFLHRQSGNTLERILPLFAAREIGWYHWGLVAGRTQTYMPWGSRAGDPMPEIWQHDVFRADGRPYAPDELDLVREFSFGELREILPTSRAAPRTWRFTTERPGEGWQQPDFDDAPWMAAPAPFGTSDIPSRAARTAWTTSDIWLRQAFDLEGAGAERLHLVIHHDEDAEVHINGVRVAVLGGYVADEHAVAIAPRLRSALRKGRNVIAVHCRQTGGGQYIDVGLADLAIRQRPRSSPASALQR